MTFYGAPVDLLCHTAHLSLRLDAVISRLGRPYELNESFGPQDIQFASHCLRGTAKFSGDGWGSKFLALTQLGENPLATTFFGISVRSIAGVGWLVDL